MSFRVVAIANVGGSNEKGKWVFFFWVKKAALGHFFDLTHAFLAMATEIQVVFVAPEDGGACFNDRFREHVVEIDDLQREGCFGVG